MDVLGWRRRHRADEHFGGNKDFGSNLKKLDLLNLETIRSGRLSDCQSSSVCVVCDRNGQVVSGHVVPWKETGIVCLFVCFWGKKFFNCGLKKTTTAG